MPLKVCDANGRPRDAGLVETGEARRRPTMNDQDEHTALLRRVELNGLAEELNEWLHELLFDEDEKTCEN